MPVTVRVESPNTVELVVPMLNVVVVGPETLCGKETEPERIVVEPAGAPVRLRDMLVGSPVVGEPELRLTVTV